MSKKKEPNQVALDYARGGGSAAPWVEKAKEIIAKHKGEFVLDAQRKSCSTDRAVMFTIPAATDLIRLRQDALAAGFTDVRTYRC
jgi:hypothetical protein